MKVYFCSQILVWCSFSVFDKWLWKLKMKWQGWQSCQEVVRTLNQVLAHNLWPHLDYRVQHWVRWPWHSGMDVASCHHEQEDTCIFHLHIWSSASCELSPCPAPTTTHTHTHQAATGDNGHWSPSSHPTRPLSLSGPRVCRQIEL